jgi:uncharacterized membrane protein YecN with MAPEG domain
VNVTQAGQENTVKLIKLNVILILVITMEHVLTHWVHLLANVKLALRVIFATWIKMSV